MYSDKLSPANAVNIIVNTTTATTATAVTASASPSRSSAATTEAVGGHGGKGERSGKGGRASSPRSSVSQVLPVLKPVWACATCTLENKGTATKCAVCGNSKPKPRKRKVDGVDELPARITHKAKSHKKGELI